MEELKWPARLNGIYFYLCIQNLSFVSVCVCECVSVERED